MSSAAALACSSRSNVRRKRVAIVQPLLDEAAAAANLRERRSTLGGRPAADRERSAQNLVRFLFDGVVDFFQNRIPVDRGRQPLPDPVVLQLRAPMVDRQNVNVPIGLGSARASRP